MVSYQSVARALKRIQSEGYGQIVCGGFSAGCDMLLRTVLFTPARCDRLILQSPWIPIMQDDAVRVIDAVGIFGVEKQPFSWRKVIGILLAAGGIILFKWE